MIIKKTVERFMDELASSRPIPGGGNVSCVVAAQAAGLVSMACEISLKSRTSGKNKKRLTDLAKSAKTLVYFGLSLAELDAEVFQRLIVVFRKRFKTPRDRRVAIQDALRYCTAACLDLLLLARDGMLIASQAAKLVKPDIRSEIHTSVYLWDAAFQGGKINTEANLVWVKERHVKTRARELVSRVTVPYKRYRVTALRALKRKTRLT